MIIPFPGAWRGDAPARRLLRAVVDDDAVLELPVEPVAMDSGIAIQYVRPAADESASQADFWITRQAPSAPDRRVLCETLAGEVIEQDLRGLLWIDGAAVDAGPLLRLGSADRDEEGPLVLGESAAFLLLAREGARYRITVEVTPPILWIFAQPRLLTDDRVLLGWTGLARCLRREQVESACAPEAGRPSSAGDPSHTGLP
jgi:hypothetical protein